MSIELAAVIFACIFETTGLVILGTMLYRMHTKMGADDAALYLQGKRALEVLEEMRRRG